MAVPGLFDFIKKQREGNVVQQQQAPAELPQIDGYVSLAGMLGPSPEERAAEEQRLQRHRQQMHGWAALFNGIRGLSNLYFTTRGAAPQQYGDPHAQIEQQYQDERKRLSDLHANNQRYYNTLWGLYRQIGDEQRRNMLAEAQSKYYGTRDEVARQKSELDKMKAVRVIKQTDGSLVKYDPVTGAIEQLKDSDPLYVEYMKSRINRNNRTGGSSSGNKGTYGYTIRKHTDPATGDIVTTRTPTTGNNPKAAPQDKREETKTVTPAKKKQDTMAGSSATKGNKIRQGTVDRKTKKTKHVGW